MLIVAKGDLNRDFFKSLMMGRGGGGGGGVREILKTKFTHSNNRILVERNSPLLRLYSSFAQSTTCKKSVK